MSRVKIGAVVAAVILALTAIAYLVATQRLEAGVRRELQDRVARAESLLTQISSLESFDIIARAQTLSRDPGVDLALTDPASRDQAGREAIARLHAAAGKAEGKPDFVAVVDMKGAVVVSDSPLPDSDDLKSRFKAVAAALERGQVSKDIWNYGKTTVRVGVAPVLDETFVPHGAAIVAYALNAKEALAHAEMLGTDVVFFSGDRVVASSFRRQAVDDLGKHEALKKITTEALSGKNTAPTAVEINGDEYVVGAVPMPLNFEDRTSGALLMASPKRAREAAGFSAVKAIIWALGAGALIVALLAMLVTSRIILHQADEIEIGVNEIINGDVDYAFKPVGADLDGLANNLNVMLARLLGRPEPGEEGLEEGAPAKVMLEEIEGHSAGTRMSSDPDVVALAREPENDYYRRTFDEYVAARRSVGESVEGVTFESFSAKLRLNEANLKKKYNCKAVRFRVQTKGNQVSLKPVPIL
jgi:hypothetical protein